MKSILVHLDASSRSAERLTLAAVLARRHQGELTACYGVLSTLLATPWAAEITDGTLMAMLSEIDQTMRSRAREQFDRLVGDSGARWSEPGNELLLRYLVRQALTSDLLVLGQPDGSDASTGAVPAELVPMVIVDSGRPALVVPYAGTFEAMPDSVLLAWKPTREAARAVTAALPWLTRAREVHIAQAPEGGDEQLPASAALEHWLQLHGVGGDMRCHRLPAAEVGGALLSLAADTGAGLLAMGCYGHSRAREWVLGGVTRSILHTMTVPILMAH